MVKLIVEVSRKNQSGGILTLMEAMKLELLKYNTKFFQSFFITFSEVKGTSSN